MEKLRIIEVDILDEVVRICNKYDINYYLAYGTLIGAVRHKGFIPWDDDIDIWMFREDYDRFAKIAEKELSEKYYYQDWHKEKEYPYNFAKVRLNDTVVLQKPITKLNIHHGIYIDIFPLDNINLKRFTKERKKITFYKILMDFSYQDFIDRGTIKNIVVKCIKKFASRTELHKEIDEINIRDNSCESVSQ